MPNLKNIPADCPRPLPGGEMPNAQCPMPYTLHPTPQLLPIIFPVTVSLLPFIL
ncbi:MAG: hypothetical protein F6J93_16690 [Oscillatoria sp. SIO1A7]|nr:hypothetical protein [Oscillatoria sp. SIO1A7]